MTPIPDCIGFIDLRYRGGCDECDYTVMCVDIVLKEKWPGLRFQRTDNDNTEEEDTQEP